MIFCSLVFLLVYILSYLGVALVIKIDIFIFNTVVLISTNLVSVIYTTLFHYFPDYVKIVIVYIFFLFFISTFCDIWRMHSLWGISTHTYYILVLFINCVCTSCAHKLTCVVSAFTDSCRWFKSEKWIMN